MQVEGVSPHGILAVTFTNKAAGEMRGRIETLLGVPSAPLWIGTFHGIAHRLLRMHWRDANLPQSFQILDSEDQQRAIRKMLKAQDLDETRWIPQEIMWFINAHKDEGLRAKHLKDDGDPTRRQFIKLYELYEEHCERTGVVDFAELLLRAFELWRDSADAARALPAALPPRAGRRVPGHERHPVRLAEAAGRARRRAVRRRRRRSVDLSLARRAGREPAAVPPRLPEREAVPPGAELSLHRQHPRRRQRADRQQHRPPRQEPVDQRASRASRSSCTPRSTSATKRTSSSTAFATGATRADGAATARSCIARTRSRERSKKRCSPRAFRIACTAACGSSSARKSRTRSATCA